jgi:uncharacterized membrane protein
MCHNTAMENDLTPAELPREIGTSRLEAFSDGVLAVVITIMVLGIKPPREDTLAALKPLIPVFLVYVLSFTFIGIYWNNHHHLLRATRRISSGVMWANLHLLFWLSLIPVTTGWVSEHALSTWPALTYGLIGFMAGIAFAILVRMIRRANKDTELDRALGSDLKGWASMGLYVLGMALSRINPILSYAVYAIVSVMWFIPDRRFVKA